MRRIMAHNHLSADQQTLARLQREDPKRLRQIAASGGHATHVKHGNDNIWLQKARAVRRGKYLARVAERDLTAQDGTE
jgi:hypothetical protein